MFSRGDGPVFRTIGASIGSARTNPACWSFDHTFTLGGMSFLLLQQGNDLETDSYSILTAPGTILGHATSKEVCIYR